ncbi:MAG TPA: cysteine desulfurase [Casimicrobiaceae bacterium]|nr:cysteine desulfurase [Casimicrobiaceae bacterium]
MKLERGVFAPAAVDVDRVRADFPILAERVNGRPLVYLDNGATTQKPRVVIDALASYYEHDNANVHRGVHTLSRRATDAYDAARVTVQRFVNAASPDEIVFVRGTTEAINLVAFSHARPRLVPGDEIVVTAMEHHSNIVPWQLTCEATGAKLVVIPIDDTGALRMDRAEELIGPRTRVVAVTHVSNALGSIVPVARIVELAHRHGAVVLVDGAQAVSHVAVDVQALGCDFYAFSGHKIFGPTGIGVLWGRAPLLAAMPPWQGGGDMIRTVAFEKTTYADPPFRFEAGTPDIAGAIGLAVALDYVAGIGLDAIAAHEEHLLADATQRLLAIPGLTIVGTAVDKASIVSFTVDGIHPHDIGTVLDQEGVAIRAGHHCAMPVMKRFGISGTARASFALYNSRADVDALAAGIESARRLFA